MRQIILIIHNVRSAHNVGSLLRSADGFGVEKVIFSGYTPYPAATKDARLPHISARVDKQINKTALGAEQNVDWSQTEEIDNKLVQLVEQDYELVALEQTNAAIDLYDYNPSEKTALIVGNEVDGLDAKTLRAAAHHIQIPMLGKKESFNVAVASAVALSHLRYSGI